MLQEGMSLPFNLGVLGMIFLLGGIFCLILKELSMWCFGGSALLLGICAFFIPNYSLQVIVGTIAALSAAASAALYISSRKKEPETNPDPD